MRPGAANASSMEHSSGSVFISQYFMNRIVVLEGESPAAVEVSPTYAGGPCLRTLAKQGGRLPVTSGSSGAPEGGDDHNSDARGRNLGKLSVRKFRALSCTAGDDHFLEQLLLLCNHVIQLTFYRH